ncbi:MAG TPA: hypothetical protein PKJ24_06340 [Prolixibacteraceae bacterium]|nr:hypothetical protein [Prolixibacteraceae bacterium]HPT30810.1 hypothetical protein [Prolixibacteraceae bacterium]
MSKNNRKIETRPTVEQQILDLTRDELLLALKNRKGYEQEAGKIIVAESLRRGLISSEEDLLRPEFNAVGPKFSFFPYPESEDTRNRIIKSLMRTMMIPGIIPVYFGIQKFGIPKIAEGSALIGSGVIWIGLALLVMLKNERRALLPLFFLLLLSALYAGRLLMAYAALKWTDIFIPVVLYMFAIYVLIYSYVLLRGKK